MPKSTSLDASITALASNFARQVAAAIRGASLGELTALAGSGSAAPGRRGKKARTARTVRVNWPKCPVCGKNAWPRGKGYCFEHGKTRGKKKAKATKKKVARKTKAATAETK